MRREGFVLALALVTAASASAQTTDRKLALLIPTLFGPSGLIVNSQALLPDGSTHSAHFNSGFQAEFNQFNIALASQLAAVPLPSPASGYTYEFDTTLGVFKRSTQSFGPLLSDRAETIGKGKFTFGFTYQGFTFDTIESLDLDAVPAVFTHDDFELGGGRSDVVTTVNSIDATVNRFVSFITYGLTSRFDVSLAVPIVAVDMRVTSQARVQRVGTTDPAVHFFRDTQGGFGSEREFVASGGASGIGDLILRLKGTAPKSGPTSLAFALDVRFPTGDEEDLLGSGAWGAKPIIIFSWALGKVSPHVNLAYQWNGESVLGGDISTGQEANLPNQFFFALGADVGLTSKLTLAFDLLGQRVVDSPRLQETTFTAANGATFPNIRFERSSFNVTNASVGAKVSAGGSLLVDLNVLVKLNDGGLRDRVTPLVGFEYSF
jgi:hypothetical protein